MNNPRSDNVDTARLANSQGMAAMRSGNHAEAIAAFTIATEADPMALPLWSNLAHACRLASDAEGERRALEAALALDRTDFGTQLRMAQLLQRLGEETRALITWNDVQQLAAGMSNIPSPLLAELDAGRDYCAELQSRMATAVDSAIGRQIDEGNETERRRLQAFVDHGLGKRQFYQKQCAGMYYPFLPADEYFDSLHFPWFADLEDHWPQIRAEWEGLLADPEINMRPYVQMSEGTPQSEWSELDKSLDWGVYFLWEYGTRNEAVAAKCPVTTAVLERIPLIRIPRRAPNAFFSTLKPHTRIPPHTGVTNTRAIIHLALKVPPECGFRVGGETREWVEGKAFAFDDTISHEAWNNSDETRCVLIIDVWNPHLSEREQNIVADYFARTDTVLSGHMLRY